MFLTNLYLFIDSVFVYLSLKFIRFYEHELSNKRLHLLFLCLLKHPHSSYPSYFSNQNFFLFSNEMTVINTENVSSIFFNIKNSNVFSYFLSFKNKFLNKINKFNSSTSQLHSVAICKLEAFCWQGKSSPKQTWELELHVKP